MITVNAMGKPCPIPVIEAKKAMAAAACGDTVLVKVDNEIACQNLEKMARGSGADCTYSQVDGDAYEVTITVGQPVAAPVQAHTGARPTDTGNFVVAVGSDRMGDGSDELGRILIKGFLYAVGELEVLPNYMLFYNSGAHLTADDSSALADLQKLQEKGVQIFTCGTCADYYGIKDRIAVGEITNMYGILTTMAEASRLIRP